jgi:acyl carrier protein
MTQEEKMALLEEVFEQDPGVLTPGMALEELNWDSMAMLTVIALVKEHFDKKLEGPQIKAFKTVGDIIDYMN